MEQETQQLVNQELKTIIRKMNSRMDNLGEKWSDALLSLRTAIINKGCQNNLNIRKKSRTHRSSGTATTHHSAKG